MAVVGMALGALMSFMAGQSYLMSAIAAWNTELLPLGYLGTAAASGAAAYLVLIAAQKADENACSLYGLMTLAAGCVALITVLAYGAVAGAFAGDAAPMTIAAAAFGGVAPIACGFLARKKPGSAVALGAVALIAAPYRFDCFPLRYVGYRRRTVRLLRSDLNRPSPRSRAGETADAEALSRSPSPTALRHRLG